MTQLRKAQEPTIRWLGRKITIGEACAHAVQAHRSGNLAGALAIYDLVLAKVPGYAEGHNNRGVVLQTLQRYEEAIASYDRAIKLKPGYANAHFNRATVLKKLARLEEALAGYDQAIALKPDHAEAFNNRGVLLQDLKRYDEARASYEKAIALKPDHAEAHNNCGIVLVSKGDMAAAEQMFLKACQLKPDFPDPLFNLVNIRNRHNAEDSELNKIRALLDQPGLPPTAREHLLFTLGKINDDCGRYDEAFEYFRQANEIRNRSVAYDPKLVGRMTDGIIDVFNADFMAQPFPFASDRRTPLLVVGMPRSGTTLMASILSNHPAIATAGELATIGDFTARLGKLTGQGGDYPEAARHLAADAAAVIISGYETRLRRDAGLEVTHVVDKNPLNFWHLGLVVKLFPHARIIHCLRDPLDTCLSNYFQRFPPHIDYSFDLRNIGHFYGQYARLMEHWRKIPALNLLEIRYEDMILRTEETARAMLEFLGLEWDERCLAPHTNPSPVETASQWQVRQPIYQQALGRWRHYEKHLGPLRESLPAQMTNDE